MKTRTLLWSIAAILLIALFTGAFWWKLRPQVITFDDGSTLTLVSVDYGKHHKPAIVRKSFNTDQDTLVVWVKQKHDPQQWANFQYYLYNAAGTACVASSGVYYGSDRQNNEIVGVQFSAFPRRQRKFYVRVQEYSQGSQEFSDNKFSISNPVHASFPSWGAENFPDTEEDENLSVTLKKLVAGVKGPYMRDSDDEDDPINQGVQAVFHAEMDGTNAGNWQPVAFDLSDATGNRDTAQSVNTQSQGDDSATTFQFGLWPDEPVWKLRVEFSKQSGFSDSELWRVSNLPLQEDRMQNFWNTGRIKNPADIFAATDLQGLRLEIFQVKHFTDMPPNSQPQGGLAIAVEPPPPDGMRLTLVELTDGQGNDINHWDYGQNQFRNRVIYRYGLQNLDGVTNLNLTLAVHKSRFVEFNVKPDVQAPVADNSSDQ